MTADRIILRDQLVEHSLPHWGSWSDLIGAGATPDELGFTCEQARLNRLNARYRVARSFRGITLDSFGPATVDGYGALFRLFLTWTAFEQYYKGLGLSAASRDGWFKVHLPADIDTRMRIFDPDNRLFKLVVSKVQNDVKTHVDAYLQRSPYGFTYLPAALRHLFAHGILTPHANNASPGNVQSLCNLMADTLLEGLGADFKTRVQSVVAKRAA